MKNFNLNSIIIALVLILGLSSVFFYSCEKEDIAPKDLTSENTPKSNDVGSDNGYIPPENYCGKIIYNPILNDEGKDVGESYSYNDAHYYYLLLLANDGFVMKNSYMHLASDFNKIPKDDFGNPDFINFQHLIKSEEEQQRLLFKVPANLLSRKTTVTAMVEFREFKHDPDKFFKAWVGKRQYGNTLLGRFFVHERGVCLKDLPTQDVAVE